MEGVDTEFLVSGYADRIMLVATQTGTLGTMMQARWGCLARCSLVGQLPEHPRSSSLHPSSAAAAACSPYDVFWALL